MEQKSANYSFLRNGSTVLLIIFSFLFIECSCKHKRYNYSNYRKLKLSDKIIKLQSTVVNKFDLFFPSAFSVINNYLVLVDSKADKLVKIIDLRSNELLISFGSRGQGPDEFMGIRQIIPDPNDKCHFWIYDVSASKLKYFNISNILSGNFYPEEIVNISHKDGYLAQLIILPDKSVLGVGFQWKGRISICDMSGNLVKSIGRIPLILKDERFAVQHSQGFIGNFTFKDVTKQIYIATRYGGIVEKYNMDGKLISTFLGPDSFFPEYDIVPAGQGHAMTYNRNTRFGYLDICYIKKLDRLFLLYSGKYKYNKDEKIRGEFSNNVYVLDNKDTIIEQIELDKDISQMCISDDGSAIFGLSQTEVLKYDYINVKSIGVNSRR
jgi:hypothetical protein